MSINIFFFMRALEIAGSVPLNYKGKKKPGNVFFCKNSEFVCIPRATQNAGGRVILLFSFQMTMVISNDLNKQSISQTHNTALYLH